IRARICDWRGERFLRSTMDPRTEPRIHVEHRLARADLSSAKPLSHMRVCNATHSHRICVLMAQLTHRTWPSNIEKRRETRSRRYLSELPAVATPVSGAIEVPTWTPVTPWPVAATSLAARAAPVPIGHDPVAVGDALGFLKHGLSREVDPPLAIDLGDFDVDLIADIHGVLHPLHPVLGQLADVDQAILVGHDLDEGAEGHDAHHLALVILADLDLAGQVANNLLCLGRRLAIHRPDHDATVVLDVDTGHARVFDDLADHLAAGADHFPDLVGMDLDGDHPRCVLRHRGARLADRGVHLVHDEEAALLRLLDGARHGVDADALDLHVHLHGGHAGSRAGHFEVHVTQCILDALNVAQHGDLAIAGDQAHRDAGHLRLDRDAGIHHRQAGAADARHRGGPVRGQDLGDEADGVG